MLAPRVDNRPYFVPLLVALVVLAWVSLIAWGYSPYDRFLHHDAFSDVTLGLNWEAAGLVSLFVVGWTVMTFAMMLPTSLPLFSMFRRMIARRADAPLLAVLLIGGYIVVWSMFGLAAHLADAGLHAGVQEWHWLDDNSQLIAGATILLAGVYQFTPLKYMCLDKCRSPFTFITEHWHGARERMSAFMLGVHHGLFCVGCCWSLMLVMFAFGVGNVAWMLALGAVMAIEKNASWGWRISAPLGVSLIISGAAILLLAAPDACAHTAAACT
jgi:predicted metal-binding membrane protein